MYAQRTIFIPGTIAPGYRAGQEISDQVVADWTLIEGEDVAAEPPGQDSSIGRPAQRPADDTDRGAWVSYAVACGSDMDDARDMDLADLMDLYPDDGAPADDRPAESANKAEWVAWAIDAGADRQWAKDSATTKANLMAYEPGEQAGTMPRRDVVAEAATEQAQANG